MQPVSAATPRITANRAANPALAQAARQFEALLFAQLLEQAMPSGGQDAQWRQLAHRAVADQLAASGSLGIQSLLNPSEKP